MEEKEYETIDLREILLLLKKNLLGLIAVTVLFAIAGYLISAFVMTPKYEASATMIVNSREEAIPQTSITKRRIHQKHYGFLWKSGKGWIFSSSNKEGQSYPWLEAERRTRLPGLILER